MRRSLKINLLLIFFLNSVFISAQSNNKGNLIKDSIQSDFKAIFLFAKKLDVEYPKFQEKKLYKRRHKYAEVLPLIEQHGKDSIFQLSTAGKSYNQREIKLLKTGNGKINVLLWSQMHGNEPTATQALFDIFNFLSSDKGFSNERALILNKLSLNFIPMLNPDGSELFQRRNAQEIDLNRDALRLSSPEAQILKKVRDRTDAAYGFNLHDQSKYYTAGLTSNPATITFLAPAFNEQKEINGNRRNAMKQIVVMNEVLQEFIPGQVSRYDDDFMPTSLGDNIQKWGTGAILIESGGYKNDPEKQYIRKMNFIAILSALYSIAKEQEKIDYNSYFLIPENKSNKLFDLLLRHVKVSNDKQNYQVDIGIRRHERDNKTHTDFSYYSTISDIGDMSYKYGYDEINASGLTIRNGNVYEKKIRSHKQLQNLDNISLINKGIIYIHVSPKLLKRAAHKKPFILVSNTDKVPAKIKLGTQANFILTQGEEIKYVIINGFIHEKITQ